MSQSYQIDTNELQKGLKSLSDKLEAATKDSVIRKGLSQGSLFLAAWSSKNRIADLNPNRKQVRSDMLTARSAFGYKRRIFGQNPSSIDQFGNQYTAKIGTNVTNKGFSYPKLHEFGGRFHKPRPVLIPAIADRGNQQAVLQFMLKVIKEALEKK